MHIKKRIEVISLLRNHMKDCGYVFLLLLVFLTQQGCYGLKLAVLRKSILMSHDIIVTHWDIKNVSFYSGHYLDVCI